MERRVSLLVTRASETDWMTLLVLALLLFQLEREILVRMTVSATNIPGAAFPLFLRKPPEDVTKRIL